MKKAEASYRASNLTELKHGTALYESGEQVRHVYFPNNALISRITQMVDGKIVEVGLVGSDGMSGLTAIHTAEERLSPWLLMCVESGGTELNLTQEFMAEMLGTRRTTVSLSSTVPGLEDLPASVMRQRDSLSEMPASWYERHYST